MQPTSKNGLADLCGTESLITHLARIGALRVIARTPVMTYKGTKKPLGEIAEDLRVDGVLEGSALRSGNRTSPVKQGRNREFHGPELSDRFKELLL